MSQAVRDAEHAYDRLLRMLTLCVGLAGLLFVNVSHPTMVGQWRVVEVWWTALATVFVLVPFTLLAAGALIFSASWLKRLTTVLVIGYSPVLALAVLAYPRNIFDREFDMVWVASVGPVVICATVLALRGPLAVLTVLAIAMATGLSYWWTIADANDLWLARNFLAKLLFGLLFAGVSLMALRGASMLDRDTQRLWESADRRLSGDARLTERGRLDALVHDTVLSALLAGGRGANPATVASSAALALRTLDGLDGSAPELGSIDSAEFVARLRQVAVSADDEVKFAVIECSPSVQVQVPVARILQEITGEALRNSVRHAAVPGRVVERWVHVSIDASAVSVLVGDNGAGFDPRRVPPQRLGIAMGMKARIAEVVGGAVDLRSTPGLGTVVHVTTPADAHVDIRGLDSRSAITVDVDAPQLMATTAPQLVGVHTLPVVALVGVWALLKAFHPWVEQVPGLLGWSYFAAGGALAAGLTLLLAPGPDPMPLRRALAVTVLAAAGAFLNTIAAGGPYAYGLGATWSWVIVTVSMALLCLRGRFMVAWAGVVATAAIYLVWAAQPSTNMDRGALAALGFSQLVLMSVCTVFSVFARTHVQRLNMTRSRTVALAAHNAVAEARLRERDEQLQYLHATAGPLLERMRDCGTLDLRAQQQALLLESRLRDRIRARALAEPDLLDAAEIARAGGAQVVLLDDGEMEQPNPVLERIVQIATAELRHCTSQKVTVRLLPPGREVLCTIVHSGDDRYERIELVAGAEPGLVTTRQVVR